MATISVIINNCNYGELVARAVESAMGQLDSKAEIVVVDDGSTDDSRAILERYRDRAMLVFQENAGQAAAINAGVRASRGEILCFLDSDDWWANGKLAAVANAMRADTKVALAYHRLQPVDPDGRRVLKPIPRTLCSGDLAPRLECTGGFWPFPMTSSLSVRRSAWEEAGPIPEELRISADAWIVGVYPFIGWVAALPEVLGFYGVHGENNWFRHVEDTDTLRRRMNHWRATVRLTNRFFEGRGDARVLRLRDHLPYQLAEARLSGVGAARRLQLALLGLRFQGEPNLARRVRDVLRSVPGLGSNARIPSEGPRP